MRVHEARPQRSQVRPPRQPAEMLEKGAGNRAARPSSAQQQRLRAQFGQSGVLPPTDPYRLQPVEGDVKAPQKMHLRTRHDPVAIAEEIRGFTGHVVRAIERGPPAVSAGRRNMARVSARTVSTGNASRSGAVRIRTSRPRGAQRAGSEPVSENSTTTGQSAAAARWLTPLSLPTVSTARCAT